MVHHLLKIDYLCNQCENLDSEMVGSKLKEKEKTIDDNIVPENKSHLIFIQY